jgi:hypothetical protein
MAGGHGEKLTRKQEQTISALLSEGTLAAAAKKAGVALRTLRNWLEEPKFKAAYRRARLAIVNGTIHQLVALSTNAVAALKKNLKCGSPPAENRAAELILTHAGKGLELADLAQRVEDLESAILAHETEPPGEAAALPLADQPTGRPGKADQPGHPGKAAG